MTTIATDRKVMAADMQMTDGKVAIRYEGKVKKIKGHLVGAAGAVGNLVRFFDWYERSLEDVDAKPPRLSKNFEGIAVQPDGTIYTYESDLAAIKISEDFYTIGSGGIVALGAMEHGASPVEAVKIAIKRDIGTGIGVVTIELDKPNKRRAVSKSNGVRRRNGVGRRS